MKLEVNQPVIVRFTIEDYTDALHFTQEEYAALTPEQIDAMAQARFDNWKAIVTAPRPEPTQAEKDAQLASMAEQVTSLKAQIAASTTPDVAVPILQGLVTATTEQIAGLETNMVSMDQALADGTLVVKG
jgi:hypothetical protein